MATTGPHAIAERLTTVLRPSDEAIEMLQRGAFAHADGNLEVAAETYEAVLGIDPDSSTALNNLGLLRMQQGEVDAAAKLLDRLVGLGDLSAVALTNVANLRVVQGHVGDAIDLLEQAVVRDPNCDGWVALGRIKMLVSDFVGAEIALREAAERLAPSGEVFEHLATCLLQRGQLDLGLAAADASVELSPRSDSAWRQLSAARMQAADLGSAVYAARCAVEAGPRQPDNYRQLALALVAIGRASDAATALDDGLAAAPHPALALDRAVLCLAESNAERAINLLDSHECSGPRADYYRAMALLVTNEPDQAVVLLKAVAASDAPESEPAAALVAQVEPQRASKRASGTAKKSKSSTTKRKAT